MLLSIAILSLGLIIYLCEYLYRAHRLRQEASKRQPFVPSTSPLSDPPHYIDEEYPPTQPEATPYYIIVDTETVDAIPKEEEIPFVSAVIALSWALVSADGLLIREEYHLLRQERQISPEAEAIHGISNEAMNLGEDPQSVYQHWLTDIARAQYCVAHNAAFHLGIIRSDMQRLGLSTEKMDELPTLCSMELGRSMGIKRNSKGVAIYPSLSELSAFLYFGKLHHPIPYRSKAVHDLRQLLRVVKRLLKSGWFAPKEPEDSSQTNVSPLDT